MCGYVAADRVWRVIPAATIAAMSPVVCVGEGVSAVRGDMSAARAMPVRGSLKCSLKTRKNVGRVLDAVVQLE